jgi:hypothetical protein
MQRKDKEKAKGKDCKDEEKKENQKDNMESGGYVKRKVKKNAVLDWKLDFNDKKLHKLYLKKYNLVLITYLRLVDKR